MTAVPFDTLKYVDGLQAGGFTMDQARTTAAALGEAIGADALATKDDLDNRLRDLEQRLT